jgi:hypothetical protein
MVTAAAAVVEVVEVVAVVAVVAVVVVVVRWVVKVENGFEKKPTKIGGMNGIG